MLILGIDPGSRSTGYGIIDTSPSQIRCVTAGCLRVDLTQDVAMRLREIYQGLDVLCQTYQPQEVAIESIFYHNNAKAALKLGQARGVALAAVAMHGHQPMEYAPRQIKQAVTGYGQAEKKQVQVMIKSLLALPKVPASDAADALAIALCHFQARRFQRFLVKNTKYKGNKD